MCYLLILKILILIWISISLLYYANGTFKYAIKNTKKSIRITIPMFSDYLLLIFVYEIYFQSINKNKMIFFIILLIISLSEKIYTLNKYKKER